MDRSLQATSLRAVLIIGLIATLSWDTATASPIQGAPIRKAADISALTELSHCRPWPHWHQWDWWGRVCGELQLPRDRRPWRLRQWRRLH
jgi:hypothetical protein